jgi:hypothetical protein
MYSPPVIDHAQDAIQGGGSSFLEKRRSHHLFPEGKADGAAINAHSVIG